MKCQFRFRKPPFYPLNYGDELRFPIFDLRLRISNKEREREQAVLLRPMAERGSCGAALRASFALDGTRENGIMNCFVMT